MVVSLPQATDPLNAPDHSKLHRVIAGDLAAPDQTLSITNGVVDVLASTKLRWNAADLATDHLLEMRVAGDTDPRFRMRTDGLLEWGPGDIAPDTSLYRLAANRLYTPSNLQVGTWIQVGSLLAADTDVLMLKATGDVATSFIVDNRGKIEWGSGAAAIDCELSRNAANELRTPDQLTVQGGVATLIKAGVPGDGDFATAVDGLLAVDTAANKLYMRSSGGWVLVGP